VLAQRLKVEEALDLSASIEPFGWSIHPLHVFPAVSGLRIGWFSPRFSYASRAARSRSADCRTRPRGKIQDRPETGEELKKSVKEIAEHIMLVDLGRNDVGASRPRVRSRWES